MKAFALPMSALALAALLSSCATTVVPAEQRTDPTGSAEEASPRSSDLAPTADWLSYAGPKEVAQDADVVIVAKYVDEHRDTLYPDVSAGGDPETNPQHGLSEEELERAREDGAIPLNVSRVEVTEVLKGGAKAGQTLEIAQIATEIDGELVPESSTTLLKDVESELLLLFLAEYDDAPYDLLNPTEALYELDQDGTLRSFSDQPGFQVGTLRELRAEIAR
ncbi:hypothetical protein J4H92_02360 [Leucobacter weissii]|uniref:Lipoprotein n=1 Tax=Leucobacter weissii TaxID=1983706 RepID=A0A939MHF5_9MICO|nr:hypothetical protein [Leucobacter weissii]MBO1900788.1 hypothetical protein [Leucobacter weissii]